MTNKIPKKKQRWEDKVFDFILRLRSKTINFDHETPYRIYVGQRIIHVQPVNQKIFIYRDRSAMRRFSIFAFLLGALFFIVIMRHNKITFFTIIISLLICFPFLVMGLSQYIQSNRAMNPWFIDLKARYLVLGKTAIPFDRVLYFNITKLSDANKVIPIHETDYSYQLNITLDNGRSIMIFTDEHKQDIEDAAQFLAQTTGIELNPKVTNA